MLKIIYTSKSKVTCFSFAQGFHKRTIVTHVGEKSFLWVFKRKIIIQLVPFVADDSLNDKYTGNDNLKAEAKLEEKKARLFIKYGLCEN